MNAQIGSAARAPRCPAYRRFSAGAVAGLAICALTWACGGPGEGASGGPGEVLRLSERFLPGLGAFELERRPGPHRTLRLSRAEGRAEIEVVETWGALALGATPLPGVWSARPSLTLSMATGQPPRELWVDGQSFRVVDADFAARAIQEGTPPPVDSFAELGGEVLVCNGEEDRPSEVELRYQLPLGNFSTGRWRQTFRSFAGDGWLMLPDADQACGSVEFDDCAGTPGTLVLRALNLYRSTEGDVPARLTVSTDSDLSIDLPLPALDADTPWAELAWELDRLPPRMEFGLEGSLAAALLDARWVPRASRAEDPRPDVLVFVADTFRADLMRAYRGAPAGDPLELTPELDTWAAEHTLFRRSWSAASWTLPSQASLLSGVPPTEHGAFATDRGVDPGAPFLASAFASAGYRCTAITGGLFLAPKYGLSADFEWFDAEASRGEVHERVGSAWKGDDPRPRFSFVQTYLTHAPYAPSPAARAAFRGRLQLAADDPSARAALDRRGAELEAAGRVRFSEDPELVAIMEGLRHLYIAGARDLDRLFLDVRRSFEESATDPNQVAIAFTSDHGEAFGEHGLIDHGHAIYEHQMRVPLVIAAPGWAAAVREDAAHTLDLAPTLAAIAGVARDPRWVGRDLGQPASATRALWSWQANGGVEAQSRGRIFGDLKVLRTAAGEAPLAFDLRRDPLELEPLAEDAPRAVEAVAEFLAEESERVRVRPGAGRGLELSGDERKALEAMGYVSAPEER